MYYSYTQKDTIQIGTGNSPLKYIRTTDYNFKYNNKLLNKCGDTASIFIIVFILKTWLKPFVSFYKIHAIQCNISDPIKNFTIFPVLFGIRKKTSPFLLKNKRDIKCTWKEVVMKKNNQPRNANTTTKEQVKKIVVVFAFFMDKNEIPSIIRKLLSRASYTQKKISKLLKKTTLYSAKSFKEIRIAPEVLFS